MSYGLLKEVYVTRSTEGSFYVTRSAEGGRRTETHLVVVGHGMGDLPIKPYVCSGMNHVLNLRLNPSQAAAVQPQVGESNVSLHDLHLPPGFLPAPWKIPGPQAPRNIRKFPPILPQKKGGKKKRQALRPRGLLGALLFSITRSCVSLRMDAWVISKRASRTARFRKPVLRAATIRETIRTVCTRRIFAKQEICGQRPRIVFRRRVAIPLL